MRKVLLLIREKSKDILLILSLALNILWLADIHTDTREPEQIAEPTTEISEEVTTANSTEITMETVGEPQAIEEITTEVAFYDVPLDEDLQLYIMNLCNERHISTALVLAMIERESNFDASAVGDNGRSFGLMQIQPRWYQERMEQLGGGDWLNPYDNVTVGINILTDLFRKYGDDVYMVLMTYNGGSSYARRMVEQGKVSDYALEIVARAEELDKERGD